MQVFCPYPDLRQSVCCLDPKRLGKFGWTETPKPDTKKAYIWSLP